MPCITLCGSNSNHDHDQVCLRYALHCKQGGGLVRALSKFNEEHPESRWIILAQTRDSKSPRSIALGSLNGVKLVQGSADDPDALFVAAGHVDAVFSVQLGLDNPGGLDAEVRQAKALADAAAAHGVHHFVYSGANCGNLAPDISTGVPHLDVKRTVEAYLRSTHPSLPVTILRPVTFMEQIAFGDGDPASLTTKITKIMFLCQLNASTRLQIVSASDVGAVAALVLQDPSAYIGEIIDVAGDACTPKELEDGWREVLGEAMRPSVFGGSALSWAVKNASKDLKAMFKFFNTVGYNADLEFSRNTHPAVHDWKTYLRGHVQIS